MHLVFSSIRIARFVDQKMAEDSSAAALKAKEAGNAAYKARDFATAISQYQQAWELHKDITFLNNLAGEGHCKVLEACIGMMLTHAAGVLQRRSSKLETMTPPSRPRRRLSTKEGNCEQITSSLQSRLR